MQDKLIEMIVTLADKIPSRKLLVTVVMLAVVLPFVLKVTAWQPYVIIASVFMVAEAFQMAAGEIAKSIENRKS